jgi:hypothetical protein
LGTVCLLVGTNQYRTGRSSLLFLQMLGFSHPPYDKSPIGGISRPHPPWATGVPLSHTILLALHRPQLTYPTDITEQITRRPDKGAGRGTPPPITFPHPSRGRSKVGGIGHGFPPNPHILPLTLNNFLDYKTWDRGWEPSPPTPPSSLTCSTTLRLKMNFLLRMKIVR